MTPPAFHPTLGRHLAPDEALIRDGRHPRFTPAFCARVVRQWETGEPAGPPEFVAGHRAAADAPPPTAPRYLPCVHLGPLIPGEPCGSPLRRCLFDGVVCTHLTPCSAAARTCRDCPHYARREAE